MHSIDHTMTAATRPALVATLPPTPVARVALATAEQALGALRRILEHDADRTVDRDASADAGELEYASWAGALEYASWMRRSPAGRA